MVRITTLGAVIALALTGCQTTNYTSGQRIEFANCAEAPSHLRLSDYTGYLCVQGTSPRTGITSHTNYMESRSGPGMVFLWHMMVGRGTYIYARDINYTMAHYRYYRKHGKPFTVLPNYNGKELTFEVSEWQTKEGLFCRTYFAQKGRPDAGVGYGTLNHIVLHACDPEKQDSAWYEAIADAIYTEHYFEGTPLPAGHLRVNLEPLPDRRKSRGKLVTRLEGTWEDHPSPLSGSMYSENKKTEGRLYFEDKDNKLSCDGQWKVTEGNYTFFPPVKGSWTANCKDGTSASGTFESPEPKVGTAAGIDNNGKAITVDFKPQ